MGVHFTAPRHLYISSAQMDCWSDPRAEFLAAYAASEAYNLYGEKGLICDTLPELDRSYNEGNIGYHKRSFDHFFSRTDWLNFMAYRKKHNC